MSGHASSDFDGCAIAPLLVSTVHETLYSPFILLPRRMGCWTFSMRRVGVLDMSMLTGHQRHFVVCGSPSQPRLSEQLPPCSLAFGPRASCRPCCGSHHIFLFLSPCAQWHVEHHDLRLNVAITCTRTRHPPSVGPGGL